MFSRTSTALHAARANLALSATFVYPRPGRFACPAVDRPRGPLPIARLAEGNRTIRRCEGVISSKTVFQAGGEAIAATCRNLAVNAAVVPHRETGGGFSAGVGFSLELKACVAMS